MNPTPDSTVAPTEEDPRLLRAAQAYLAELEAGRRPERRAFAARFPELAEALVPYLDALDLVHREAPRLQSSMGSRRSPADPPPAEPLGDFRIEREIGRGGMGVVYEAVQMSLGRRVALKVLPFAAALDAKQLQRFQNEAQAAAQLHHTNIVPVYAVGHERGVHYYAMQLIEGQNLADLIGAMRAQEPTGGRGLALLTGRPQSAAIVAAADLPPTGPPLEAPASTTAPLTQMAAQFSTQRATRSTGFYRTAARLAAQAAEALEHAHQVGVIHRDIKPANLLIDARGNLWVTDFGLAQFQNRAGLTRTGDLLGTLRYMSPEQAGGQGVALDPRTDIYSLGATLYELLTLEPLFGGTDHARLLRQILTEEPRALRTVERSVPPELETIVLKALSKTPAERYATAQEFADDLHRFLDNQPIRARRPNFLQRTRKWAQRHPSFIWAAVVLLVLSSAGSIASALAINSERKRANDRADEAEKRFLVARQSVDDMIDVSEDVLVDRPDMVGLRKRLLESAVDYYQQFIEQHPDDPKLVSTREKVQTIIEDLEVLQEGMRLFLLDDKAVRAELQVTPEQKARLDPFLKRFEARFDRSEELGKKASAGSADTDTRSQRLGYLEQVRADSTEVRAFLKKSQLRRLGEVWLQGQGAGAFHQPDVLAALKLTTAQRQQIGNFEREAFPFGPFGRWHGGPAPGGAPGEGRGDREPGPPPGDHPGPDGHSPQMIRRAKDAMEKSLAVLTDEQQGHWREMTGEPFDGALAACHSWGPPRFGGGFGGPGRGGMGKPGFGFGKPGGRGGQGPNPGGPAGNGDKPNGPPDP